MRIVTRLVFIVVVEAVVVVSQLSVRCSLWGGLVRERSSIDSSGSKQSVALRLVVEDPQSD